MSVRILKGRSSCLRESNYFKQLYLSIEVENILSLQGKFDICFYVTMTGTI